MAETKARFIWYDLMTTDVPAAEAFYGAVNGWKGMDSGMPGSAYRLIGTGDGVVGGMMGMSAEAREGEMPMWLGHIGVDDVDAMAKRVKEAGGTIRREPTEIPGVGRFAVAADPHGAVFLLFQPNQAMGPAESSELPGRFSWNELHGGELATDWAFYSGLFGWTKSQAIDMGPMGVYQVFETGGAGGGMMTKMPEMPRPMWLYYANVEAAGAAVERIEGAGGTVMMGPQEVPGGGWIVQGMDPQGAMFAVVAPKPWRNALRGGSVGLLELR